MYRLIPVNSLTRDEAVAELKNLEEEISTCDQKYYEENESIIPDDEYDTLRQRLLDIETRFPYLKSENSPSDRVGILVSHKSRKVLHSVPMLSLDNVFAEEETRAFVDRIHRSLDLPSGSVVFYAEPKIDGVSLSLYYESGRLIRAATRGNGFEGEEVTDNVMTIPDIPKQLPEDVPQVMEIRGEVYMTKTDFQKLNERQVLENGKMFSNPRNATSGSLRHLDSSAVEKKRFLRFFAYSCPHALPGIPVNTQHDLLELMRAWGLPVGKSGKRCYSLEELIAYHAQVSAERESLDYCIDGVVYKVDAFDLQIRLGSSSRAPRWAVAHKLRAQVAMTTIQGIDIQVGRTGVLTPVARLHPVSLGGVSISSASLYNKEEITRLGIHIGDRVVIQRAGDVIPRVVEVVPGTRVSGSSPYVFPELCPCDLQSPVTFKTASRTATKGTVARCSGGLACPHQSVEWLKHFVSRSAFDIRGFGPKQVEFFFKDLELPVREPADIFTLCERDRSNDRKLKDRKGFGEQSVEVLFASIETARKVPLVRLIYSLGIPEVGEVTARLLANFYGSWDRFHAESIKIASDDPDAVAKIKGIDGVGDVAVTSIKSYFSLGRKRSCAERLIDQLSEITHVTPVVVDRGQEGKDSIYGKSVVFTGTLYKMTRSEAQAMAERLGARVSSTISSRTDVLVAGQNGGSKRDAALRLGIPIMSEEAWLDLVRSVF